MRSRANFWRVLLLAAMFCLPVAAGDLQVRWSGNRLSVTSHDTHFLYGRAIDRLRDGATVDFDLQLSLRNDTRSVVVARAVDRFVVSYDLWEEKFAVVQASSRRKAPGLMTAPEVESWCIENLSLPTTGLIGFKRYVATLDVRNEPAGEDQSPMTPNTLISRLVELFSSTTRGAQQRVAAESAPFRLLDLRAMPSRGTP